MTKRDSAEPRGAARVTKTEGAERRRSGNAPYAPPLFDAEVWLVAAITGAEVDAAKPERFVTAGPRMSAAERLDVYRSGYRARFIECLRDDYPVLAATLGEVRFEELCLAYVDRHPSSSPNLNVFGRHMAAFCGEARVPDFDDVRAFASELAALEWALVEVVHEADATKLDPGALAALPVESWAAARFRRAPAVRLLGFEHPVNAHFQRFRDEGEVPEVPAKSPTAVVVYRKDLTVWRMDLTAAMVAVLAPLLEGATIGDALAQLEAHVPHPEQLAEAARSLTTWFREWTVAGLFAGIDVDTIV